VLCKYVQGGNNAESICVFYLELTNFNMVKVHIHDNKSYISMSVQTDVVFEGTLAFSTGVIHVLLRFTVML
jgi:hypothetical protein